MARSGRATHETIDVAGRSASEIEAVLTRAVATDGSYRFAPSGHANYRLVRTFRPTWATVVGVWGLLVVGLGVLFFLVKKTETCALTISNGPTGTVVTVSGALLPATLEALRSSLQTSEVMPPPASHRRRQLVAAPNPQRELITSISTARSTPPAEVVHAVPDDATVMRSASPVRPTGWSARVDGRDVVDLTTPLVLGRDPSPLSELPGARLVALADADRTTSKTHACLGVDEQGAWVKDLRSTNGTAVAPPGGDPHRIEPGVRVPLVDGAVVSVGTARVVVGRG